MTEAELSEIAGDAANLYDKLLANRIPERQAAEWVAHAMPAIVTRATDGGALSGPLVTPRGGGARYSDTPLG